LNERILHKDVQDFIRQNLKSNLTQLILKGSPFDGITVQELANQIVTQQKSEKKLPTWFQTENIYYPPKLNLEQTSSEVTANYKASLVSGKLIIDIPGGFGVDCVAFSKQFKKVTHCEQNEELSQIASYNFKQLGIDNIETIAGDGIAYLKPSNKPFDCIYVDPSRRSDVKGKVFLLKDCEPNLPEHLNFLFQKTNTILIKVSPILDISSAIGELNFVKEVHVVAVQGQVKELLFLAEKNHSGDIKIKTINFQKNTTETFDFIYKSEAKSNYSLPQKYLYEPNAAILKSGGFHHVSEQLNVQKLHPHSHLYTSEHQINFPGRTFEIEHIVNYDKKKLRKLISHSKANVTTRNFPKSVQQIRKELKLKDGGHQYLFFTTNSKEQLTCILCKKI
jgi:16S rRNA G966 N2-methylase RsmD